MEKLEINHFKAFGNRIAFILSAQRKNLLLYGENGAGKTSVYEALKLLFFRDRLLKGKITIGGTPEQRQNEEEAFYKEYQHKGDTVDIELKLNGISYKDINRTAYQSFMISNIDVESLFPSNTKDNLNLVNILKKAYIDCDDIDSFVSGNVGKIISEVNISLSQDFIENINIGQENTDFDIFVEDVNAKLRASEGLHTIFNEAKLNLVRLLLILESILLLKVTDTTKYKVLVLDDVVTSLDASNRLYITKYLLAKFSDFQKVVLTHNIGFNNLFVNQIKSQNKENEWNFENLYQTNCGANLYDYNELKTSMDIKREFEGGLLQPNTVGNEIRKRFEAVVLELSKILQIEASQEAKDLTTRLVNGKPIYIRAKSKKLLVGEDLVSSISNILNSTDNNPDKIQKAKKEIDMYQTNPNMPKIIPMIKEMKTYQKVMIHQLSHGKTCTMPGFIQKEVEGSMLLLAKLEAEVETLKKSIGMM